MPNTLLAAAIQQLDTENSEEMRIQGYLSAFATSGSGPAFFSNDCGFSAVIQGLSKALPAIANSDPTRPTKAALLVGESRFLHCLPEIALHADTVIFCDCDCKVLMENLIQLHFFDTSANYQEFEAKLLSTQNRILEIVPFILHDGSTKKFEPSDIQRVYLQSIDRLDPEHRLSDPARFAACKAARAKIHFQHLTIDFFNTSQISALSQILSRTNSVVSLVNLTNLHHYDANWPLTKYLSQHIYKVWQRNRNIDDNLRILLTGSGQTSPNNALVICSVIDEWDVYQVQNPKLVSIVMRGFDAYVHRIDAEQERMKHAVTFITAVVAKRANLVTSFSSSVANAAGAWPPPGSYVNENGMTVAPPPKRSKPHHI